MFYYSLSKEQENFININIFIAIMSWKNWEKHIKVLSIITAVIVALNLIMFLIGLSAGGLDPFGMGLFLIIYIIPSAVIIALMWTIVLLVYHFKKSKK